MMLRFYCGARTGEGLFEAGLRQELQACPIVKRSRAEDAPIVACRPARRGLPICGSTARGLRGQRGQGGFGCHCESHDKEDT
jgi:hypothetical protein